MKTEPPCLLRHLFTSFHGKHVILVCHKCSIFGTLRQHILEADVERSLPLPELAGVLMCNDCAHKIIYMVNTSNSACTNGKPQAMLSKPMGFKSTKAEALLQLQTTSSAWDAIIDAGKIGPGIGDIMKGQIRKLLDEIHGSKIHPTKTTIVQNRFSQLRSHNT